MESIKAIAAKHNLVVIEDACQAHGARYQNQMAGSIGDLACFSFYPGKNLGAYGEAGAVTTRNKAMAEEIAKIRDHGQRIKYHHDLEGYNGRMDAIQAGILQVKLKQLAQWNDARRRHAAQYSVLLKNGNGLTLPTELPDCRSVYHLYVILADNRDALQAYLAEKGIATGLHYPVPLHLQNAYRHMGYQKGDFPVTEKVAERLISLPMHPMLEPEQIQYVTDCINEFYS
jgi:dTDP-4-amino-4,6-dideoxygalactose transaminase